MTEKKHTALPWHACNNGECSCFSISSKHHPIATVEHGIWGDSFPTIAYHPNGAPYIDMNFMEYGEIPEEEARANWKFIVRACNSHYELLEMLEELLTDYIDVFDMMNDYAVDSYNAKSESPDDRPIVLKARALIAKARGETDVT